MDPIDNGEILFILLRQCFDSWWIGTSLASFLQYWKTEPYHPSFTLKGSSSGRKATQKIPKWSLKLMRFTRLLPCQRTTRAESPSQMKGSQAAKKTLRRANLIAAVWKEFRPTEAPGKDILQPGEPSRGCVVSPGSQLFELSPMLCGLWWCSWVWVISAPVSYTS